MVRVLPFVAVVFFAGCTTVVRCPEPEGEAATVLLLAHGKSSSLVLPDPSDGATRWAFGDWRYYAEGDTSLMAMIAAAAWPTPAALGREEIESPADVEGEADRVMPLRVEADEVRALRARLEGTFAAHESTLHYNPESRLHFVMPEERYTLVNSSNRKVASWIRDLGCLTSGITLLSRWATE
jgi:hypothetical protein